MAKKSIPGKGNDFLRPRASVLVTILSFLFVIYAILPFVWLVINSTKSQASFISTFGLAFGPSFDLLTNIAEVFQYQDGIFFRWLINTLAYTVIGAVGSTFIAALGGFALAKFSFRGKSVLMLIIIGSISVPGIALAIPQFLLFAKMGITNTPLAVIIPSLMNPFGLFLMWVFISQLVPSSLLEAGRIDGASHTRIFAQIVAPLLGPAAVTVFLFSFVGIWNNYFLPLIMLKDPKLYPLTLGLNQWNMLGNTAGNGDLIQNLIITGSLITVFPLILAFLFLQRYWRSGIAVGAVKG